LSLLASDPVAGVAQALWPVDHLLGCAGEERGVWLSEGGGESPAWKEIGQRIHELFLLGYGLSAQGRRSSQAYFAEGLALTLVDRRQLNTVDPKLDRLLGGSLLNRGFCRRHLPKGDR
jgi:hypothetical protein